MCEIATVHEKVEDAPKEKDVVDESETEPELPPKTADISNHHMDSTRWDLVNFRQGDIIIGTYAKSGMFQFPSPYMVVSLEQNKL